MKLDEYSTSIRAWLLRHFCLEKAWNQARRGSLVGAAACLSLACADGGRTSETVLRSAQALSANQARALGFESTADWTVSSGTKQAVAEHVEGSASLGISGIGYADISSTPLSSLGAIAPTAQLDLKLPTQQPNPWWYGAISLSVDVPSLGISSAYLGQVSLTGMPLGSFQRLSFSIPADLIARLQQPYTDLRFRITLNVPSGTGTYLLDRLSVVSGNTPGQSVASCVPGSNCPVYVHLPRGVASDQGGLFAEESLTLADRSKVTTPSGTAGLIANAGAGASMLGVEANVGVLWSAGPVTLRDRAHLDALHALAAPALGSGATIAGAVSVLRDDLFPLQQIGWAVRIPGTFGVGLTVQPDSAATLAPGAYDHLVINSRSTVTLQSGRYFLNSLDLEPQSQLVLQQASGPVELYVLSTIVYRGAVRSATGDNPRLLLVYVGTQPVFVEAPLFATVVAPNATLSLRSTAPAAYSGAFYAKNVDTQPDVTVTAYPPVLGTATPRDRKACLQSLTRDPSLPADQQQKQFDLDALVNCIAPGIPACDARMTAAANADRRLAAQQFVGQVLDSSQYLAISRDRTHKLHLARHDPALLNEYCQGDADGDLVPDTLDACPGTPPLTTTDDRGCTTVEHPAAPPRQLVDYLLAQQGIVADLRCDGAPDPETPRTLAFLGNYSVFLDYFVVASNVGNQPPACSVFYEFDIFDFEQGRSFYMVFDQNESRDPFTGVTTVIDYQGVQARLFSPHTVDPGDRGSWATLLKQEAPPPILALPRVSIRVRAVNGNGQASPWSGPRILP